MLAQIRPALVALLVLTLITGVAYPFAVTGVAKLALRDKADGSLVRDKDGNVIGSRLIGQPFSDAKYFWGRLSATSVDVGLVGREGATQPMTDKGEPAIVADAAAPPSLPYNAENSVGPNYGPTSPELAKAAQARIDALKEADPENTAPIPVDLVTSSASGLASRHQPGGGALSSAPRGQSTRTCDRRRCEGAGHCACARARSRRAWRAAGECAGAQSGARRAGEQESLTRCVERIPCRNVSAIRRGLRCGRQREEFGGRGGSKLHGKMEERIMLSRRRFTSVVCLLAASAPGIALAQEPTDQPPNQQPTPPPPPPVAPPPVVAPPPPAAPAPTAPAAADTKKEPPAEPFAFGDFTWLNGATASTRRCSTLRTSRPSSSST